MPSFHRLSFSLIEVQMNWPTFLLGSHGPLACGQLRSSVFGKLSGVAANQSGGVLPVFLISARTSALDLPPPAPDFDDAALPEAEGSAGALPPFSFKTRFFPPTARA